MEIFMSNLLSILAKNYQIENEIGRGGMGVVYLATDKRLNRKVAIKVLSLTPSNEAEVSSDEIITRFQREAKSVARLSHPNIVTIFDIGEEDNKYYMIMEFLEGKTLAALLEEKKRLSPLLAVSIGIQLCNALEYAHANGIIHRDIKPENIILTRAGVAKLTDFGIAQFNKEQIKLTQAGALLGSFMYIPPEQLEDSASVDARADIYSLGITIYEIMSGVLPFEAESVSQYFLKILSEKPRKLSSFYSDIPEILDPIIEKAIFRIAAGRYQTAKEMAIDLSKVFASEQISYENPGRFFTGEFSEKLFDGTKEDETLHASKAKEITNTGLRRKILNKTITRILKNNYNWVKNLVQGWKSGQVTGNNLQQVFDKILNYSAATPAFSGALLINEIIFIFVFEGYIIGAIDIENDFKGEQVFDSLPQNPAKIELKIPPNDKIFSPALISAIIEGTGEIVHKNISSSRLDLLTLVSNISYQEEPFNGYFSCNTENNTFYYGYYKGEPVFAEPVSKTDDNSFRDLKTFITTQNVIFNVYKVKPVLAGPSVTNLLKNSVIHIKFKSERLSLSNIITLEEEEIPQNIINELKKNTKLVISLSQPETINLLDFEINLLKLVRNTLQYQFAEWLVQEYFILCGSTKTINFFRSILNWIGGIEYLKFYENLPGEDGKTHQFSLVFHGELSNEINEKVLIVMRSGSGTFEDIGEFIEETIQVKKKLGKNGDIGAAIYVSTEEYTRETLNLFNERTTEPKRVFSLSNEKTSKNKGIVRMGFGRTFQLFLLEHRPEDNSFNLIAPEQ
jgi:serine/threonine protein kinase